MTFQQAIAILILSPFYFKLSPADRKELVQEYCDLFNKIAVHQEDKDGSNK